jgi:hypothetical protein
VGFPTGLRCSTRRITTMPNNKECPGKQRVDKLADDASKELQKVKNAHPELDLSLVEKPLGKIPLDNHHRL